MHAHTYTPNDRLYHGPQIRISIGKLLDRQRDIIILLGYTK